MNGQHLGDKKVKEMAPFQTHLVTAKDQTIAKMVRQIIDHPAAHHLCVVDEGGRLQGLISRERIFQAVFAYHASGSARVSQLFTLVASESADDLFIRDVYTASGEDRVDEVIRTIIEHGLVEVPVVDEGGKILGLLTSEMLLRKWLTEEASRRGGKL
jgi:CBS domain-containing protein